MHRAVVAEFALDREADGIDEAVVVDQHGAVHTVPVFRDSHGRVLCRVPGEPADWSAVTVGGRVLSPSRTFPVTAPWIAADAEGALLRSLDGLPYLWLADTQWFALTDRVSTEEWAQLLRQRQELGYNTLQLVAGLLPETDFATPASQLNGRSAWLPGQDGLELDPAWWDAADERIATAAELGFVAAVVGAWSYYLRDLGAEALRRHWHQVVARWAAFPTVWCVAGEMGLMHYEELGQPDANQVARDIQAEWAPVAAHLREIDPWSRPTTAHPCPAFGDHTSLDVIDPQLVDLVWMQTGHAGTNSVVPSLDALARARSLSRKPVLNSEVCYEGIAGGSEAMLQRFLFWSHLLSGAAGHTYGAQGVWAFHDGMDSPGAMWGDVPWPVAAALPGAAQLGHGAKLLRELGWAGSRPAQHRVVPGADLDNPYRLWAGEVGDAVVVYAPAATLRPAGIGISTELTQVEVSGFVDVDSCRLRVVNPRTGRTVRDERVPVVDGTVTLPDGSRKTALPTLEDWVVVIAP